MTERINKPKVFLSHSSPDKPFIEKLARDLHKCKIEYWLDTEEIRDGRSWPKVIFEDGIPTCDAVIVYLTENSLHSKMVEKELDATVVEQLSERGITLLPYVSSADLRPQLRSDIRSLQCREWNDSNYQDVLPTVIAEIWRSYLERTVETAVLQEKTKRLELELETNRLREQYESSMFTPREAQEFQYLLQKLDRTVDVRLGLYGNRGKDKVDVRLGDEVCSASLLRILFDCILKGQIYLDPYDIQSPLLDRQSPDLALADHPEAKRSYGDGIEEEVARQIQSELHTYGLVKLTRRSSTYRTEVVYEFSEKMYRFKYWLDYNNLAPDDSVERVVKIYPERQSVPQSDEDRATARALEADQKISLARRLNAWRTTGDGINAGTEAIQRLFEDLEQRVSNSNQVLRNIKLEFRQDAPTSCNVTNGVLSLVVTWITPSSNVQDSLLSMSVFLMKSQSHEASTTSTGTRQVYRSEFRVDAKEDLTMIWRWKDQGGREPCSINEIADNCWTTMLNYIQRSEEGDL